MRRFVEKVYLVNLGVVFGAVVIHAPLAMLFGKWFTEMAPYIKGWKEAILLINGFILIYLLSSLPDLRAHLKKEPVIWLIVAYCLWHLLLTGMNWPGWHAYLAGLAIDLRYVVFFAMVYIALLMKPEMKALLLRVGLIGAIVVFTFTALQLTVLPKDLLTHIGYGFEPGKIAPYSLVDDNENYIRATGTLRGPNPFGAYSLIVLAASLCYMLFSKAKKHYIWLLVLCASIMAWFSYSRSALLGILLAVAAILCVRYWRTHKPYVLSAAAALLILPLLLFTVLRHTYFVSTVIFHDSQETGAVTTSNDGHVESLYEGFTRLVRQPLGAGIGSTGSPSYYSEQQEGMLIIENQYFNVAHESGWLGLVLYLSILGAVMSRLWKSFTTDWVAAAAFSSGAGLLLASIFLPVFVDDTIAYIWWGLAGMAMAGTSRSRESFTRRFINWNIKLSDAFDRRFVPKSWRVDGLQDYRENILPPLVKRAKVIYDLGGGKIPYVGTILKKRKDQLVIGVDIDKSELDRAPAGAYDDAIVSDIGSQGLKAPAKKADLVICQVVLEHVQNNQQAIKNISQLTSGGVRLLCLFPQKMLYLLGLTSYYRNG